MGTLKEERTDYIKWCMVGNKYNTGGYVLSLDFKEKLRGNTRGSANKGKPKSEETRKKMAEAALKRWAKAA